MMAKEGWNLRYESTNTAEVFISADEAGDIDEAIELGYEKIHDGEADFEFEEDEWEYVGQ